MTALLPRCADIYQCCPVEMGHLMWGVIYQTVHCRKICILKTGTSAHTFKMLHFNVGYFSSQLAHFPLSESFVTLRYPINQDVELDVLDSTLR